MFKIKGIVFDFDGTITKPFFDFGKIKDEIGMPRDMLILEFLKDKDEEFCNNAHRIIDKWELEAAENAELNDGVLEVFDYLKERSIKTAILTRNKMETVEIVLKKYSISFDYIDTRDTLPIKPHPDAMLRVKKNLDLPPEKILTIGDYEHDIVCGKSAGTVTMYITNGNKNPELKNTADYTISNFREGLNIIKSLIE
jgi:HAD superfamily hydrolase (TIGR01549 family)